MSEQPPIEEHLARRLVEGDEEAMGEIYHLYHERLVRFCGNFVVNRQDAEDLSQDAFVQFRKSIDQFRVGASIGPWLYKIARNKCLDFLKKKKPVLLDRRWSDSLSGNTMELNLQALGPSPATAAERADLRQSLAGVLDDLSEEQRTVFLLKYVEELSRQEIAEALEIPAATVKSRLYHTVKKIRESLSSV